MAGRNAESRNTLYCMTLALLAFLNMTAGEPPRATVLGGRQIKFRKSLDETRPAHGTGRRRISAALFLGEARSLLRSGPATSPERAPISTARHPPNHAGVGSGQQARDDVKGPIGGAKSLSH